ncbi:MAG: glycosyltransferase family 2 [Paenibacillaceae bacterium]|jgi:dolichol-phosphate mannosyltransferase|nr:glycosyltransferase family 2 [Paenibacillaceae bacterium]
MVSNKEKNFLSVVLYVHNNEENLKNFLPKLYPILNDNFNAFEIIFVNDCSVDDSVAAIRQFSNTFDNAMISIVNMSVYQGLEISMNAGVDLAIGDFVFEFDNLVIDYDPHLILQVYQEALKGYNIVTAAPEKNKRSSSRLFYSIYNKFTRSGDKLRNETFRVLTRKAINRVHSINKTVPYRKAIYANCGLKTTTISYPSLKSKDKKFSKREVTYRSELAMDSFILFTNLAYRVALAISVLMLLSTIGVGIYTCVVFFWVKQPVEGWTTTMLFLSSGFFGVFLLLSIIIKYLSVLVDMTFKRQKYLVDSIEKITK